MSYSERFWARTEKADDGCWNWLGALYRNGYGAACYGGRNRLAHRVAWVLAKDVKMPPRNVLVLHRCDNRRCVNPDHLFLGSAKDNTQDMIAKGRGLVGGAKSPHAKLSEADVRVIREHLARGESTYSIAPLFGVTQSCIWEISTGKSWKQTA